MTPRMTLVVLAALAATTLPARADTLAYDRGRPVPAPQPAPRLAIVSPAHKQVMTTRRVEGEVELACLLDSKDRWITIAADHWPVSPRGAGVLVVVDGAYATTVHDLSKPISMEALEPFAGDKGGTLAVSPLSKCGWHWIAVVPTAANGQMLAVPPVVSWFLNKPTRESDLPNKTLDDHLASALVVINWPLIGTFYPGTGDTGAGWRVASRDRIAVDVTVAQRPTCGVKLKVGDLELALGAPGVAFVKNVPSGQDLGLDFIEECPNGDGSMYWDGARLYVTAPPKAAARTWPAMSAKIDATQRTAERAAHRLPGKRPYDGVFHAIGGTGLGNLTCPNPVKVTNASADLPIVLAQTLSFGTVKIVVDRDGYIDPQRFELPKPKPLPGKAADAADFAAEAAQIAAVEVSGEFATEQNRGKRGTRLELAIDVIGPDGTKTGRGCTRDLLIEGYSREIRTCDTSDSCGTPGHDKCCRRR